MRARFIVRVLNAALEILAWAEVEAEPHPQRNGASCPFFPVTRTQFVIERDGTTALMTIHWADLDVARQKTLDPIDVKAGQVFDFTWIEPVWLVAGMRDVPLPGVTVRQSITIGVPTGSLGMVGQGLG